MYLVAQRWQATQIKCIAYVTHALDPFHTHMHMSPMRSNLTHNLTALGWIRSMERMSLRNLGLHIWEQ